MLRSLILLLAMLFAAAPAIAGEYDLVVARGFTTVDGKPRPAVTINGAVPGPQLRFREGETAVVRVTNRLDEETSIHWHGLILAGLQDGVPGLNGFPGIKPGETFTYRFPIVQNGTYWYHAHSATQEQAGHYGAIVIDPKDGPADAADRDYVLLLSESTPEDPERMLRNLKADAGYYNYDKRTVGDFFRDARQFGLGKAWKDRVAWGRMRMDPTDIADTGGLTFLANGRTARDNPTFLYAPGQTVRLRMINASAMSFMDVRIPGLKMTVVASDGRDVQPVEVDEFRIAPAEIYDVLVTPRDGRAYTVFAESVDRRGFVRATLAPREGMSAEVPSMRPRAVLTQSEMGHMGGMDADAHAGHAGHDHAAMTAEAGAPGSLPKTDYGMGRLTMAMAEMAPEGALDGSGRVMGWSSGAPAGSRVLSYADLKSRTPVADARAPTREIIVRLGGVMERYIWTINGKRYDEAEPIAVRHGDRVKLTFINETMMAHPMHLHGMFFQLDNGQAPADMPEKNVISIAPGRSASVLLTADAPGEWAFHCHLLYHMEAGMMRHMVVAHVDGGAAPGPVHSGHDAHAGHGSHH